MDEIDFWNLVEQTTESKLMNLVGQTERELRTAWMHVGRITPFILVDTDAVRQFAANGLEVLSFTAMVFKHPDPELDRICSYMQIAFLDGENQRMVTTPFTIS